MALQGITSMSIKKGLQSILSSGPIHTPTKSKFVLMAVAVQMRGISSMAVTKNISYITKDKKDTKIINLKLERPEDKPLVVLLSWLMARKKHVYKYAELYLEKGFDVLNVSVSPWQLLWPTKGTQVIAKDLLTFLELNSSLSPLLLHGFSVGGYIWGEVLVNIAAEKQKYDFVLDKIIGQIWDSAADITEISIGLPVAVFPKNLVMQAALKQYLQYHMKTFDKVATRHYVRSSQMFHTNLVRSPALFFLSKSDAIGSEKSNQRVRENWENMGIQVYWKCWDKSPHVGHFRVHRKEYVQLLHSFLEEINCQQISQENIAEKLKAKL